MLRRQALLVLTIISAVCLVGSAPAAAETPRGKIVRSWNGLGIRAGPECGVCCGLVFPKGFGSKGPQLALLREIAEGKGRAAELGCGYAYKLEVFEQLVRLAVDERSDEAALLVLSADSDAGIDLGGGELAEAVGSRFMLPVLLGRRGLGNLLGPVLETHVATKLCVAALGMASRPPIDVGEVVGKLRAGGMVALAAKTSEVCRRMEEELRR